MKYAERVTYNIYAYLGFAEQVKKKYWYFIDS